MNERLFSGTENDAEKTIEDASRDLMRELRETELLNKWGFAMGDPNPWMVDVKPVKKSRSEKKQEEEFRAALESNKKNRGLVLKEIASYFRSWKAEKRVEDEMALKIWENITNNLQHRGWPGMRDAVLEALYNPEESEQAA